MQLKSILPALLLPAVLAAETGTLTTPKGICPLKHTEVKAKISGPLARVTVTQEFENPFQEKIEAVYTFPLPADSAVDDMTMLVGDRTIRGLIKPRDEARKIYEEARRNGRIAGLLDQERPNIFTQAVANIMPGAKVKIEISYVETMPYEGGSYEFHFPMVVAPRYMPTRVPDASRISPPVTPEGTRAGHDISVEVSVDAGVPIEALASKTHDVAVERPSPERAVVRLRDKAAIPNKDFILRYAVAGRRVEDAVLTHRAGKGGFFTLLLQPPDRVAPAEATPKELVFVLDTSGSMSGFPIEKAKETMQLALDGLNPRDTFNLITFSGDTHILFPKPVPATAENLRSAREFLQSRYGGGGTEMMKAIRAALEPSGAPDHVRVVCFMTDGEVGNDFEILGEVQRHPEARVFAFGIGSSVNRFLLDGMARYGRGEVEYVGLKDDGSAAARRFHERVQSPLLTDVSIDWGGLPVTDVYPARIPDLFAAKPVVISGRYSSAASGVIRLRGKMAGREFTREIRVGPARLPAGQRRAGDAVGAPQGGRSDEPGFSRDAERLDAGRFEGADHETRAGVPPGHAVHFVRGGGGEDRHRRRPAAARGSAGGDAGGHELRRRIRQRKQLDPGDGCPDGVSQNGDGRGRGRSAGAIHGNGCRGRASTAATRRAGGSPDRGGDPAGEARWTSRRGRSAVRLRRRCVRADHVERPLARRSRRAAEGGLRDGAAERQSHHRPRAGCGAGGDLEARVRRLDRARRGNIFAFASPGLHWSRCACSRVPPAPVKPASFWNA